NRPRLIRRFRSATNARILPRLNRHAPALLTRPRLARKNEEAKSADARHHASKPDRGCILAGRARILEGPARASFPLRDGLAWPSLDRSLVVEEKTVFRVVAVVAVLFPLNAALAQPPGKVQTATPADTLKFLKGFK